MRPPLTTDPAFHGCRQFDTRRGKILLALAALSGGGLLLTTIQQQFSLPAQAEQALNFLLVFW